MKFMKLLMLGAMVVMAMNQTIAAKEEKKASSKPAMGGFAVKVVAVTLAPQLIQEKVTVVGSLAANEAVDVKSEIDGNIKEIKFDEGQQVTKGQELIVLDRQKLEAGFNQRHATLSIAQATYERMKTLVESGAVSRQEFDEAKAGLDEQTAQVALLQAQLDETVITAPFDGMISQRLVSPGQVIVKDQMLTSIIDDDPMKIECRVPERYLAKLAVGQKVNLKVAAFDKQVFQGEVYFIDPQVNDITRTALVKAKVDNPEHVLRRGMFAKLDLVISEKPNAIAVPETALISNGETVMVFTIDAEKKAQMAFVKTGIRTDGVIEVVEGLKVGDQVITEGFQKIGPGSMVDPINAEQVAK